MHSVAITISQMLRYVSCRWNCNSIRREWNNMSKILVADDDLMVRTVVKKRLAHAGHSVVIARDGIEALHQFECEDPDLALLDASMPWVSGFDVCREIRTLDPHRNCKVVFLSGATVPTADYVSRCANACEADAYIRKPYEADDLLRVIENVLETD